MSEETKFLKVEQFIVPAGTGFAGETNGLHLQAHAHGIPGVPDNSLYRVTIEKSVKPFSERLEDAMVEFRGTLEQVRGFRREYVGFAPDHHHYRHLRTCHQRARCALLKLVEKGE